MQENEIISGEKKIDRMKKESFVKKKIISELAVLKDDIEFVCYYQDQYYLIDLRKKLYLYSKKILYIDSLLNQK